MLSQIASPFGIEISKAQEDKFAQFYELLIFWNAKINLTAITDKHDVYVKHFLDSLFMLDCLKGKGLDIGTGAGFPAVPLAIMNPELNLTLVDTLRKRCDFLELVRRELDLDFEIICARAEELPRQHRGKYDFAVSRAVASLRILSELTLPYLKKGGTFYAMKANGARNEISEAQETITSCGGEKAKITDYYLPENIHRCVISIKKEHDTPAEYPRKWKKIKTRRH